MIKVETAEIDATAPYFDLVKRCAEIKKALVDETVASETDEGALKAGALAEANGDLALVDVAPTKTTDKAEALKPVAPVLVVGQRIIIPGNLAPTFIPPQSPSTSKN